jgi:gliding motility-associated-like protein
MGVLFFLCACGTGRAQQAILIRNASFEGQLRGSVPPPQWLACDSVSTPDTQPNAADRVDLGASEGQTYLSLVCRGDYRDFSPFPPGSYEGTYQLLTRPLQAGNTYCLAMDLAFPGENTLNGGQSPASLRIWGGTASGKRTELLYSSPRIDHKRWKSYGCRLNPTRTHASLILECYYYQLPVYWGAIVVDNLRATTVLPAGILGKDTTLCLSDSVLLSPRLPSGEPLTVLRWSDESSGSELYAKSAGVYWVEALDGCFVYRDSVVVKTKECEDKFLIPNVITPNGDGKNDVFRFPSLSLQNWELTIVNPWGKVIYRQQDYQQDWPAANGPESELAGGMYYYRLEHKPPPGKDRYNPVKPIIHKPLSGWLQVIR